MYTLNVMKVSANSMCARVLMRAANLPFQEVEVYGHTRSPEYIAKCPAHHAPLLESDDLPRGALPDSAAIMQYLCEAHNLTHFYPDDIAQRAMVNSALYYHAGAIYPLVGKTVYPIFDFPPYPADLRGAPVDDAIKERGRLDAQAAIADVLEVVRQFFLKGEFIGGAHPCIADIRLASTLEWLPVAQYDFADWTQRYLEQIEVTLGQSYSEPAADIRGFVAYTLQSQSI